VKRRNVLKLTGMVATAGAVGVLGRGVVLRLPRQAAPSEGPLQAPGLYQISGRVRLDEPLVEISGITNAQQITWSGASGPLPRVAGFSSFENFDRPWRMPEIQVRGGTLEAVSVVPVHFV